MNERCNQEFARLLQAFPVEQTEGAKNVVFGLSSDFRIAYFNLSWVQFARANGAPAALGTPACLGISVLDVCGSELRPFYEDWFASCLLAGKTALFPFQREYECSSAELYRRFAMTLYPLGKGDGLLVVNMLLEESPHGNRKGKPRAADPAEYVAENGFIRQCAHCRKIQHPREADRWDWVPDWVKYAPSNTSHGMCPLCLTFYYRK